jgi:hypothetical protein
MKSSGSERSLYTTTTTTTQIFVGVYNQDSMRLRDILVGTKHYQVITAVATALPLDRTTLYDILIVVFPLFQQYFSHLT